MKNSSLRFLVLITGIILWGLVAACSNSMGQTAPLSAKAITAFSFVSPVATGVIDESTKTISVTVPSGTDVTALVASFTMTGSRVQVNSTTQVSGTTANNFASPVTYTVTAADATTTTSYTVSVYKEREEFTIVILPDSQNYSSSYPEIWTSQVRWIVDNAQKKNVKMVISEGDIVNDGSSANELENAKLAIDTLNNANIPFLPCIGNHDYDQTDPSKRSTINFNKYLGYDQVKGKDYLKGVYQEGSAENAYYKFLINGTQYLIVILEFGPRDSVIAWADSIIQSNEDSYVIVVTHAYLYSDGNRLSKKDHPSHYWDPHDYGIVDTNNGEELWQKLIRLHKNIKLVLSAHVLNSGVDRRIDIGDQGNTVNQLLANYQMLPNGGNGYLRYLKFSPVNAEITVYTYSPFTMQFLQDSENQFTISY